MGEDGKLIEVDEWLVSVSTLIVTFICDVKRKRLAHIANHGRTKA